MIPRLRKLTFTGSTRVGQELVEQSAEQLLRLSMELGGNAPFLVFEDADVDAAVDGAMLAKMRNIGEACTAANRFFVHESLADEFSTRMAARMGALTVGNGTNDGVEVGPLITAKARNGVHELVEDAVQAGARVLTGGSVPEGPGYFYPPTVLTDVPATARLMREEIFGPVAPIAPSATRTRCSSAPTTPSTASSPTSSPATTRACCGSARRWSSAWSASTPASSPTPRPRSAGVKHSGFGREGGFEGIEEYLETKYVGTAL